MSSVDERVVEMQFKNEDFEKGVRKSLISLKNLKQGLNLDKSTKSLSNLESTANNFSMKNLASSVASISDRFSTMGIIGMTALQNITNSAIATGKTLVSALTVDPVKSGFQEYETQINAVQTILANTESKGTTLDQVNAALDELNRYADMTIYNFTEMTRNIGTFTAAGVDLDTSVAAIKGIANLAAVSGSNSQQASTAMYQLSQALAAGTVKLQDWNSVVNAGMGGQVFQDALKETARVHGVAIDQMIKDEGSFRETLSKGWITSDVLTETLAKFTGDLNESQLKTMGYTDEQIASIIKMGKTANDAATKVKTVSQLFDTLGEAMQSGWTQSWEYIVGNFDQAKESLTAVSDVLSNIINNSANKRNDLLQDALTSNYDKFIKTINDAGIETTVFQDRVKAAINENGGDADVLIQKYGTLEKAIRAGAVSSDLLKKSLGGMSKESLNIDRLLHFKDAGDDVKNIQEALKQLGYDLSKYGTDGLIGSETTAAIKAFQQAKDLSVDGIVGPDTVKALQDAVGSTDKLKSNVDEMLDNITKKGGRDLGIETIGYAWKGLIRIAHDVKAAYKDIFPKEFTSDDLYGIIQKLHDLSFNLLYNSETSDQLQRSFKGLFAALDIVGTVTGGALRFGFRTLCDLLKASDIDILEFTANIGDNIVKLRDAIHNNELYTSALKFTSTNLKKGVVFLKEWTTKLYESEEVQNGIKKIQEELGKGVDKLGSYFEIGASKLTAFINGCKSSDNVGSYFEIGASKITAFIDRCKSLDKIDLTNIGEVLKDFKENVLGYFVNTDKIFDGIEKAIDKFKSIAHDGLSFIVGDFDTFSDGLHKLSELSWDSAVKGFSNLREAIGNFVDTVSSKLPSLDWGPIMAIVGSVGIISVAKQIGKLFKVIKPLKALADSLANGVGGFIKAFNSNLKANALVKRAEAIKTVAEALAILAGSLAVIAMVPKDDLARSFDALISMMGVLAALTVALGAANKYIADVESAGKGMKSLAAGVLILALSLKIMENMDITAATQNAILIGTLAVVLLGVSTALGTLKNGPLASGGKTFLAISASILILVQALKSLATAKGDIDGATSTLMILMGAMAAIYAIMQWSSGKFKSDASAKGLLAIAASLYLVVLSMKKLAKMNPDEIRKGLSGIAGIFTILIAVMAATRLAGKQAKKAGVGILAISASLILIALSIKMIAGIDNSDIAKGIITLGLVTVLYGVLMGISKLPGGGNSDKIGSMMLKMSAGMLILAAAMKVISTIDGADILKCIGSISALMVMMTLLSEAASSSVEHSAKSLTSMAIVIGTIAGALALLSMCDTASVGVAGAVIAGIMYVCSLVAKSADAAKKSVVGLGIMVGVVALIAVIIGALSKLADPNSVLTTAESISLVLGAITAACAVLTVAKVNPAGAAQAALGLVAFVGVLATLFSALGGVLSLVNDFTGGAVDKALDYLKTVLFKVGDAVGALVGGFAAGVTSGLPEIGSNLSAFAENAAGFFNVLSTLKPECATAAGTLASAIGSFVGSGVIDGLFEKFTGTSSLAGLGGNLTELGEALTAFYDSTKSITDTGHMTAVVEVAQGIAQLNNALPNTGGKLQEWLGSKDLGLFATGAKSLGEAMKSFSEATTGITDPGNLSTVVDVAKSIADLNSALPETGGGLQKITGWKDLGGKFSAGITALGTALKSFNESVGGDNKVDSDAIDAAANAGQLMAALAKEVPTSGGLIDFFMGGNDIGKFGESLKTFGEKIADFSGSAADINADQMKTVMDITSDLVGLANNMGADNGFAAASANLTEFARNLVEFGTQFNTGFYAEIQAVDASKITSVTTAIQTFYQICSENAGKTIDTSNLEIFTTELGSKMKTLNSDLSGLTGINDFGTTIVQFGIKLATFYEYVNKVNTGKINTVSAAIKSMYDTMSKCQGNFDTSGMQSYLSSMNSSMSDSMSGLSSSITSASSGANSAMGSLFDTMSGTIKQRSTGISSSFTSLGNDMIKAIVAALASGANTVASTASSVALSGVSGARGQYGGYYSAGVFCVSGLAAGISAGQSAAINTAAAVAAAALAAAKAKLGIRSPSREFYAVGGYAIQGFVNALSDGEKTASSTSADVAEASLSGLQNSISAISALMQEGINTSPVITPVIDDSQVQSGIQSINNMMNNLTVSRNMQMAGASFGVNQNGDNSDVVSAINDLRKEIVDRPQNIYTVNGITYDDGSNVSDAVGTLIRAINVERRA